ncbi:scavenger receptor cysteine-rich domain-containing protein DMBT1-like [Hemitrygon akajei]|uniref:scavenger receptor cysteine-rich domain-containing protein DMBT1-like n=1 Tax=Hemitrygon akajei TaxID=2704970 RepID=UPI003BF9BDD6
MRSEGGNERGWSGGAEVRDAEILKLRLVNGGTRCAGRVELGYKGFWWSVWSSFWNQRAAAVACRELNCGAALKTLGDAHFGKGSGPVLMSHVKCGGSESTLRECTIDDWFNYDYPHKKDVGVICEGHRTARLVSGNDECSGRLEVQFGDSWGTVCDLHWDMNNANVVCNQLQCGVVVSVLGGAYFGEGEEPVWDKILECQGNESSLSDCKHSSRLPRCNHKNDVSLTCSGKHGPRLVDGNSRCSGRVEVLHGDQWGTLCDEYFRLEDAAVVCEHLKCGAVNATARGVDFGEGKGPLWKYNYLCLGNESRLTDCPVSALGQINCSQGNPVSVICSADIWSLRLSDGGSRCDGRVAVYDNGTWHRVYDKDWNLNDANVVCGQLRCGFATFAYNSSRSRETERPVWITEVQCVGNETEMQNCNTSVLKRSFSHITGVGVQCSDHVQVRLSGSADPCAGRLEIYYHGSWDLVDANVVCRQLGCGYALEEKNLVICGRSTGEIWLDEMRCLGNETKLWNCPSAPWGQHDCSHKEDVTVECSEHKEMRLVNGNHSCEGRVEVRYNGRWGTICSDKLDKTAASVICKQMKCGTMESIQYDYQKYGKGSDPIWLDEIECLSHESTLWQCHAEPWGKHDCQHNEDAGVECKETKILERSSLKACEARYVSQTELPLRLSGGNTNCSGRLEIQSNNIWGTICDDTWGIADANVACRQLACGSALWTVVSDKEHQGVDDIWLDEVNCKGSEAFLSSCPSSPLGQHDCDHKEDVFVVCSVLENKFSSVLFAVCVTFGIVVVIWFTAYMMALSAEPLILPMLQSLLPDVADDPVMHRVADNDLENEVRSKSLRRGRPRIHGYVCCLATGVGVEALGSDGARYSVSEGWSEARRFRTDSELAVVRCFQCAALASLRHWSFIAGREFLPPTVCVR